tara:strand:+ start:1011 stop:1562 length:552 start_codon:yes stop_codon:yes gene_type:complete
MALPDLTNQNIQDTYQRILQVSSSGEIVNGTGSLFTPPTASYAITASYAVSASVEITQEITSSYAQTASYAANIYGTPNINVGAITATSLITDFNVETSKQLIAPEGIINSITSSLNISSSGVIISKKYQFDDGGSNHYMERNEANNILNVKFPGIHLNGEITASNNISASGEIIGTINGGTF